MEPLPPLLCNFAHFVLFAPYHALCYASNTVKQRCIEDSIVFTALAVFIDLNFDRFASICVAQKQC